MEEIQFTTVMVECKTDNCENQNIALEVIVVYPDGAVLCGGCHKGIVFVRPTSPDATESQA